MEFEALDCPICLESYNLVDKLPKILPECGHTICRKCLTKFLQDESTKRCPFDNLSLELPKSVAFEDYLTNLSLKYLLEEILADEICHQHQERKRIVCMTDKELICNHCVIFGDHKSHVVRTTKEIKSNLDTKRKYLEDVLKDFQKHHNDAIRALEEVGISLLKTTRFRFEELRRLLKKKEAEITHQMNSFLDMQKEGLARSLGSRSSFQFNLKRKISHYKDLFKCKNFFNLVEENVQDIVSKINSTVLDPINAKFNESLEEFVDNFDHSLSSHVQKLLDLDFPVKNLSDVLATYFNNFSNDPYVLSYKPQEDIAIYNTMFEFQVEGDRLLIRRENKDPEDITVDMAKFRDTEDRYRS